MKVLDSTTQSLSDQKDRVLRMVSRRKADKHSGDAALMLETEERKFTATYMSALNAHFGHLYKRIDSQMKLANKALADMSDPRRFVSFGDTLPPQQLEVKIRATKEVLQLFKNNSQWKQDREQAFLQLVDFWVSEACAKLAPAVKGLEKALEYLVADLHNTDGAFIDDHYDTVNEATKVLAIEIVQRLAYTQERIAIGCSVWMQNYVHREYKDAKAIVTSRASRSGVVLMDLGLIAGHVAHAAASWGVTAPLAIVGIARNAAEIATIIVVAVTSLNRLEKKIRQWLKKTVSWYGAGEARATITDVALNAVKGAVNMPVPSVSTCYELIEHYEHKIRCLTLSFDQLQHEMNELGEQLAIYHELAKLTDDDGVNKKSQEAVKRVIKSTQQGFDVMLACCNSKRDRIAQAKLNVENWKNILGELKEKTGNWGTYVGKGVSAAMGVACGIGATAAAPVEGLEEAAHHTHEVLVEIAPTIIELLGDPLLERFSHLYS